MFDATFRVTMGDFRFYDTDANGCEWLANLVDSAWNSAGTTHAHSAKAFNSGWFANRSARLGRSLTIEGNVVAPSYDAFLASRQLMLSAVPLESGTLTVDFHGVARQYTVRQDSGEVLLTYVGGLVWSFSIPLVSLSPYSFDVGAGVSGSTGLPESDGGLGYPYAFTGGSRRFAALTAQWQGTPNASPSRLLDGSGNIIATNLLPNPGFDGSGTPLSISGVSAQYLDGQLTITPVKNQPYGSFASYELSNLAEGSSIRLRIINSSLNASADVECRITSDDWKLSTPITHPDSSGVILTDDFVVPSDGKASIIIENSAATGVAASFSHVICSTSADWQAMQAAGVTWFDGDYTRDAYGSYAFTETATSGGVSLLNPGSAPSPVTLRVDGPVTNPRIEHQQSGAILELAMSLGAGHYVTFDGSTRQILVDGSDPARGIVTRRGWSDALPGDNTWEFSADGHTDGAKLTVSFRGAYL
ncbi:MAG: phage tail family protein [Bifidobacterium sp.]|jgi:hypothetical protein|nr:phage tail family protein [Bifidobacterium sp.]MCI1864478.1 phage tail family protein [Bifidobacterium sp.]